MPQNGVGDVRSLQPRDFGGVERHFQRGNGVVEVLWFRCADDGGGNEGFLAHPGERDLGPGDAAGGGERRKLFDDSAVGIEGRFVELVAEGIALGPRSFTGPITSQPAAGEGTPGHHADAFAEAQRHHLPLFLSIEQVVVVLHGHEGRPEVLPSKV